jgi:hypothetical protein
VTLLVIVGNRSRGRFVVLAAGKRKRDTDERTTEADGASANLGWSFGHN